MACAPVGPDLGACHCQKGPRFRFCQLVAQTLMRDGHVYLILQLVELWNFLDGF